MIQEISILHAEELDLVAGGARVSPANASNVEYFALKSIATQGGVGAGLSRQGWRTTRVTIGYAGTTRVADLDTNLPYGVLDMLWPQDRWDPFPNNGSLDIGF